MARTLLLLSSLAALAALAACESDPEPGGPCRTDMTCGGSLVCNFQATSPTCLAPEKDEDGDGLKNEDDFCPNTNEASNNDEDGDGQGDACDLCPIETFRASVKDTDGDKLVGTCDPAPTEPGDKIVFFEAFDKPAALSAWTLDTPANLSVSNGALRVTVTGAGPSAEAKHDLPTTATTLAAFAAYRVVDAAPSGVSNASRQVNVALYDPAPNTGSGSVLCGPVSADGGAGRLTVTTTQGQSSSALVSSFTVNEPYRLLVQQEGSSARCVQIRGDLTTVATTNLEGALRPGVSLSVRGVSASYDYVLVISSPVR
ncbi:MAG: hypothetical protein IPI49_28085 [Myxococcales bacterium]|nr:hypothetical protein [Myxococcales bacterium]